MGKRGERGREREEEDDVVSLTCGGPQVLLVFVFASCANVRSIKTAYIFLSVLKDEGCVLIGIVNL